MRTFLFLLPLLILGQPQTKKPPAKPHKAKYLKEQRELLKMSLFCRCVYSHDSLYHKKLNEGSASVLFQIESYGGSTYDRFKEIVNGYKEPRVTDFDGTPLIFYDCLKFYNSQYLDSAVKSLDKYLAEEKADIDEKYPAKDKK